MFDWIRRRKVVKINPARDQLHFEQLCLSCSYSLITKEQYSVITCPGCGDLIVQDYDVPVIPVYLEI